MENEQAYKELLTTIIKNKMKVFGKLALKIANTSGGMTINDDGEVAFIHDDPIKVVEGLLNGFIKLSGRATIFNARIAVMPIKKKYPNLKLPELLAG